MKTEFSVAAVATAAPALLEQCVEGEDLVNEHVAAGAGAEA